MKLAIVAAGFTPDQGQRPAAPGDGDVPQSRHDRPHERLMIDGMVGRGYDGDFARALLRADQGFWQLRLSESHAASFAKLVYVSSFIKCCRRFSPARC